MDYLNKYKKDGYIAIDCAYTPQEVDSMKNIVNNLNLDQYEHSKDKYGYPFIGNHWIPHITIGSMDINPEKLLEYSKKLLDLPKEITINNLGLFKIEGDSHQLIKKIEF